MVESEEKKNPVTENMSNYAFDALLSKLDFDSNNHAKRKGTVVRSNNKMNF